MSDRPTRDQAIEELAKELVATLEHVDPTESWDSELSTDQNWARLSDHDRSVYRTAIEAVLSNYDLVKVAITT
jgi:hypothetical protein